jgi:hypothetical protein
MSSPSISVTNCGTAFSLASRERLHRRQPRALRLILDGLLLGPARRRDARAQVLEVRLGEFERERPDCLRVR